MRHLAVSMALLIVLGPPLSAQQEPAKDQAKEKPPTPAEQLKTLQEEYDKATSDFYTEYRQAKTNEERQKLVQEKYPKPDKMAKKCLELAQKNPKDEVAVDALLWVLQHTRGPDANSAVETLLADHIQSPKMATVAQFLNYSGMPKADEHLHTLLEKNPDKQVKAQACFSLAQSYQRQAERPGLPKEKHDELIKQTEVYLNRVIAEFGDVKSYRRTMGELAKASLFELQHLQIGMTAPNIEGDDLDGKKFSLQDYRGKVVVLDFWGNW